jgi:hypothetical protein
LSTFLFSKYGHTSGHPARPIAGTDILQVVVEEDSQQKPGHSLSSHPGGNSQDGIREEIT